MTSAAFSLCVVLAIPSWAQQNRSRFISDFLDHYSPVDTASAPALDPALVRGLSQAALNQTKQPTTYDSSYTAIKYPGGDVPASRGVCTDVLVRAYRKTATDLQVDVHEDMKAAFAEYPRIYGRRNPDSNIDHRRVPNLMVFFRRRGTTLPISKRAEDYHPGDIVAWDLHGGVTHIGLVVDKKNPDGSRYLIVHNIGMGPKLEDVLFDWKIIGHFRYAGRRRP
ncbi:MAG: DUF1287 domain-containing protein [Elusimicrobia bacterium]|nr:DUF1287 domain-containing protein [Elusimicrobiota bacterium]